MKTLLSLKTLVGPEATFTSSISFEPKTHFYVLQTLGKNGLTPAGIGKRCARWSRCCQFPSLHPGSINCPPVTPLAAPPAFVRAALVSGAKAPSTRCLILSATRKCPAACLFDFASASLRQILRPNRRVAARRPPIVGLPPAAPPGTLRRWRPGQSLLDIFTF